MLAKVVPPATIFLQLSPIRKKLSGDLRDDLTTTQAHISMKVILRKFRAFHPEVSPHLPIAGLLENRQRSHPLSL
jgi:hypothetical protein